MSPVQKKRLTRSTGSKANQQNATAKNKRKSEASASASASSAVALNSPPPPPFQEHPLFNSLILLKIVECSKPSLDELKQIRLVCKDWRDITLAKWRKTAVIRLIPDTLFFNKKSFTDISIGDHFKEFQNEESPNQLAKTRFTRYKFKDMTIDLSACDEEGDSKLFWEQIGSKIKYVHFEKCAFMDSLERDKPFVQLLVRKLPNLQHLALTDVKMAKKASQPEKNGERNNRREKSKTFRKCHPNLTTITVQGALKVDLGSLFTLTPNLQSISGMDGNPGKENKVDYYHLLREVERTISVYCGREGKFKKGLTPLPNLKHLDLMKTSTFSECSNLTLAVQQLAQANMTLETFIATLRQDRRHPLLPTFLARGSPDGNIDQFLFSLTSTLQVLKLFRAPFSRPFPRFLCPTEMTALRELHLWGNITSNFHFLKCTPNLEVLYVNLECFEKRKEMENLINESNFTRAICVYEKYTGDMADLTCPTWMEGVVVPKLQTLYIDYAFPVNSLNMMAKWMPNLKSLQTILTKSTASVVCEQWKGLTELVCLFGSKLENYNFVCNDRNKRRSCAATTGATIGNLKYLEKFHLNSLCGESTLSDSCVKNGLLKMPALKSVQICVSKKMSTKAEEMLKIRFGPNCRVIRNYTGGDHSNYECCEREKFNFDCANNGLIRQESEDEVSSSSPSSSSSSDSE